jgi:hypothetical protein
MASIYANSHFTIIAADGSNADYGLQGISSPRRFKNRQLKFGVNVSMIVHPQVESFERKPCWHSSAWRFQERAVSLRTLVFTDNTVYWECRSARWYENIKSAPDFVKLLYQSHTVKDNSTYREFRTHTTPTHTEFRSEKS